MSWFVTSVHPTASFQVEVERRIRICRHGDDLVDLNLDFISRYCNVGGGVGGTETLDSFSAPFIASFALFLHCHANEEVEHGGAVEEGHLIRTKSCTAESAKLVPDDILNQDSSSF